MRDQLEQFSNEIAEKIAEKWRFCGAAATIKLGPSPSGLGSIPLGECFADVAVEIRRGDLRGDDNRLVPSASKPSDGRARRGRRAPHPGIRLGECSPSSRLSVRFPE
jgi:hypothetical protein